MENDPSKKDSKGKRLFKKAVRRNSKSSNGSQSSALEQGIGVTRSKSFEDKDRALEINDTTPLPTPDGPGDQPEHSHSQGGQKLKPDNKTQALSVKQDGPSDQVKLKKIVDIQEERNEVYDETATGSKKDRSRISLKLDKKTEPENSRRGIKRVGGLAMNP